MKKLKIFIIAMFLLNLIFGLIVLFKMEQTQIAFVNYQGQTIAELHSANNSIWISVHDMSLKESDFSECNQYSLILMNHIGHLSEEQNTNIKDCMDKGVLVHVTLATSPDYKHSNLDSAQLEALKPYLRGVGAENQQRFLNYVRVKLDNKTLGTQEIEAPEVHPADVYYRMGQGYFETWEEYLADYKKQGLYQEKAPFIALSSAGASPQSQFRPHLDSLIIQLESQGYNIAVVAGWRKKLALLKEMNPVAVVNFPHGRLQMMKGDIALKWLQDNNILYFTPQMVPASKKAWLEDKRGMTGGLLGQNIVVPEVDGGIGAYALATMEPNQDGFAVPTALPERIKRYVQVIDHWLDLRTKANSDKKIVIYYYKGAGKNALVAGGIEVGESLHSILQNLKKQGYNLDGLPTSTEALLKDIQKEGSLYSIEDTPGAFEQYMKRAQPDLISKTELEKWLQEELHPKSIEQLKVKYGEAPGKHYVVSQPEKSVVIPHVRYGNIYLTPLMPSALGESEFDMQHGVDVPPPYSYVASYLWARKKVQADAIWHMGAHGSVEFIPGKQVLNSQQDWAEVLTYPIPHLYPYSVDNIGEAMMAKRRTYATMLSHMTPAMTESSMDSKLKDLCIEMDRMEALTDSLQYEESRLQLFKKLGELGLDQDLAWKSHTLEDLTEERMEEVHMYLHHLENEKISTGLHVFGVPYSEQETQQTVLMMTLDPLYAGLKDLGYFQADHGPQAQADRAQAKQWILKVLAGGDVSSKLASFNGVDSLQEEYQHVQQVLQNVNDFYQAVKASPNSELASTIQGMAGGLIHPSTGGDIVGNPYAAPTGRNLYSINAENTPNVVQWEVAKKLAQTMIKKYVDKHGEYPKKMAYSLWGGEFIRNQGMNVGQILYLMGVEPVRNRRGRVYDVKLIDAQELGRPRIDVVVQTSGQFRDIGGSRIPLIHKAIKLVQEVAGTEEFPNYVKEGSTEAEQALKAKGISPVDAKKLANLRVFGGLNGSYGTGIMGLVENGEKWDTQDQLADQYLNNLNAVYSDEEWGESFEGLFETQLANASVVVHPRSSNATGPISLDHVYEFMGGISAAIQKVTGKDPEAYFNDNRNTHNPKTQGLKEAIWSEARTSILSAKYIKAWMAEGPTAAEGMAENMRNTFGWNALKPSAVDSTLWGSYYDVYVKDSLNLGVDQFFEEVNPYAFQEMTGVMMEAIRKKLWTPDSNTVATIAQAHYASIEKHDPGCSEFVCGNPKLEQFIQEQLSAAQQKTYSQKIQAEKLSQEAQKQDEVILEKEESTELVQFQWNSTWMWIIIISLILILGVGWLTNRHKK